jgi:hypothetical protein
MLRLIDLIFADPLKTGTHEEIDCFVCIDLLTMKNKKGRGYEKGSVPALPHSASLRG